MGMPIIPVSKYDGSRVFQVSEDLVVRAVYTECMDGVLRPIKFKQQDDLITIKIDPIGKLYFRYKNNQ
jgi:hypothetical protein